MNVTAFDIAARFSGLKEIPGKSDNPQVLAMLRLDDSWPQNDEVPWCSAFVNYVAWLLRAPRSKSLLARSWLQVGRPVPLTEARIGWDVVIFSRGSEPQPGPDVIQAPGHVGLFAGLEGDDVLVLGGNQGNTVSIERRPRSRVLGVRRLREE